MQNIPAYTLQDIFGIASSLIKFYGAEVALFFTVLTFFWNNKKLSPHKIWIIVAFSFTIFAVIFIGLLYLDTSILVFYKQKKFLDEKIIFLRSSLIFGFLGLLFLPLSFLSLYFKSKSFRSSKNFSHYFRLLLKGKNNNIEYISSMQKRSNFSFFGIEFDEKMKNAIIGGGSVLIISENSTSDIVKKATMKFLLDGMVANETVDYVTVDQHPFKVKENLDNCATNRSINLNSYAKDDFLIIDAFSPNYGFDEDIVVKNSESILNEICVIKARSLMDIHSSAMKAWYIHKDRLKKNTGKTLRRPHRMVYDHLSRLLGNETQDDLINYYTHLISSEKAYGMITVIIEYKNTNEIVLNTLKQLVDIVFQVNNNNGKIEIKLTKFQDKSLSQSNF